MDGRERANFISLPRESTEPTNIECKTNHLMIRRDFDSEGLCPHTKCPPSVSGMWNRSLTPQIDKTPFPKLQLHHCPLTLLHLSLPYVRPHSPTTIIPLTASATHTVYRQQHQDTCHQQHAFNTSNAPKSLKIIPPLPQYSNLSLPRHLP